jgi:hypothetical protein
VIARHRFRPLCSAETRVFVLNVIDRCSVSDCTPGTLVGKDGSFEAFLRQEAPTDPKERDNWLPAPDGRIHILTRHYSPQAAIPPGNWARPPVLQR